MHNEHPELIRDQYWDTVNFTLPHTLASEPFRISQPHLGSAMNISMSVKDREFVEPPDVLGTIAESDDCEKSTGDGQFMHINVPGSATNLSYGTTPDRQTVVDRLASHIPGYSRLMSFSSIRSTATISSKRPSVNQQPGESCKMAASATRSRIGSRSEDGRRIGARGGARTNVDKNNCEVDSDAVGSITSDDRTLRLRLDSATTGNGENWNDQPSGGGERGTSPGLTTPAHERCNMFATLPDEEIFAISDLEEEDSAPLTAVSVDKSSPTAER